VKPIYTEDLEELVTYGFEGLDPNETIEVNLHDLMYVHATLQEFQRFFHQPLHYRTLEDVERFLGSINDNAAYKLLHNSIHEKMRNMLPEHIDKMFNDGDFDSPKLPFYFDTDR